MSEPTVTLFCDGAVELARLTDVFLEYAARDDLIGDLADIAMHQFRRKEGSGTIASTADSPKDDKTAATTRSYAAVSAWLALAWAAVASAGALVGGGLGSGSRAGVGVLLPGSSGVLSASSPPAKLILTEP